MPEYPQEQLWKIYENLPTELKKLIFSNDSAENIANVCQKNGITDDEKMSEIARLTGDVLLGIMPPAEFQKTLEKELKLKPEVAKKIDFGIYRFIFYPVKDSLAALYQTEVNVPESLEKIKNMESASRETEEKKEKKSKRKDVYRESFE